MLDFRYHALSLAAVLCALAVGVLVGIAIGDSSLVSSAQDGLVHNLRGEVGEAQQRLQSADQGLGEERSLVAQLWPLSVRGLLEGRAVGLVFLGRSSDEVNSLVRGAVHEAGGEVRSVLAVREPLEVDALATELGGTRYAALAASPKLLRRFALHIGEEAVSGGRLLERTRTALLSSDDGQAGALGAVVVTRSRPSGMSTQAEALAEQMELGLIAGMDARGVPVVGVETTATQPSQIGWYKQQGLSSVDDLQSVGGRVALAYALAGYSGTFGSKATADALLPAATTTVTATTATGGHP